MKPLHSSLETLKHAICGEDDFTSDDILGQVQSQPMYPKPIPLYRLLAYSKVGYQRLEAVIKQVRVR